MRNVHTSVDWPDLTHRRLETLAVGVAALLAAMVLVQLVAVLDRFGAWVAFSCALVVSYLVSDLVSGLVHWTFDHVLDERSPVLGPNFVQPFREHHDDPTGITRHDFIELNGNTCIAAAPVLAATLVALDPANGNTATVFGVAFVVFFATWTVMTNQFHQWSHQADPPRVVRLLQRCRIILSRDHHAVHHNPPFDTRYCITSGIMNRWIDRSGLLLAAESWILSQRRRSK